MIREREGKRERGKRVSNKRKHERERKHEGKKGESKSTKEGWKLRGIMATFLLASDCDYKQTTLPNKAV